MQSSKLYVGNFNYTVNVDQLKELFSPFGEVKQVNIIEGRGFGFIEMASAEEAAKAKEGLDGTDFEGRTLRIDEARPPKRREQREQRRPSGGGGGFRRRN